MSFPDIFYNHSMNCAPILGTTFKAENVCRISFAQDNVVLKNFDVQHYEGLQTYLDSCLMAQKATIAMGGYLEHRLLYQTSPHFESSEESRCIHLGIDLWAAVGTPIFAPLDGIVHSFKYNDKVLDYGATIILAHELDGKVFYCLYGHLSKASLKGLTKGKMIKKGTNFAEMGARDENGGWVPHLHFQVILDMLNMEGDFVGVVSKKEAVRYQRICPDPQPLIVFTD
ncbi:MAG: peptidoglycan DD-metalloendopeptidase family protein [Saprospiraceae bacterium]